MQSNQQGVVRRDMTSFLNFEHVKTGTGLDLLRPVSDVYLIPKHLLHVGPNRPISETHVRKLVRNWEDVKSLTLEVRPIDAITEHGFEVIIGNHRTIAAGRRPDVTHLRCHVNFGMSSEEAAELWRSEAKDKKNPTAPDMFGNALLRNDTGALEIERLIQSIGRSAAQTKSSNPTNVACLGTVVNLYKKNSGVLARVFPLFGRICEGEVAQEMILRGLFTTEERLLLGGSLTHKKWSDKLIRMGYKRLLKLMNDATPHRGCHSERVWVETILHQLNQRLQVETRLVARGINDEEPWAQERMDRVLKATTQFMND